MTPHNEAKKSDIAKIVLMPGDPLRAEWIAKTYLTKPKLVNKVRGMYAYTGIYKNKRITVMGHGMGIPSIGIYSYELFKFYDVDYIIRVGSTGGYKKDIQVGDVIISKSAFSESNYAIDVGLKTHSKTLYPSKCLFDLAVAKANELGIRHHLSQVFSEDVFYNKYTLLQNVKRSHNSDCVEMEAFALYANADLLHKQALVLLTCSDSFVSHKSMSPEQRQKSFKSMVELALNLTTQIK